MPRLAGLLLSLLFLLPVAATNAAPNPPGPLHESELLALAAGNALPENIVAEIRARGLAFAPDSNYRSYLKLAGGTDAVLTALDSAKRNPPTLPEKPDAQLLQHIATAGKLIREKKFDQAANELTPALTGNFESYEVGFVMGELLRQREDWGQAAAVYAEVLELAPEFPEAHTKLSYLFHRLGAGEEALREAKAALARTPQNAEAHKNAGLALYTLGKLEASMAEYKEALRLKPDYPAVHHNMVLTLREERDFNGAIAESQKLVAMDPSADSHYTLALSFAAAGNLQSALREYREAKRLDPGFYDARHNLAQTLYDLGLYEESVREFRELEASFPNSAMCHLCLGEALRMTWDSKGAEKEFLEAARLDPSDPTPLVYLGSALEDEKKLDAALVEYHKALQLDANSGTAHLCIGRVLLAKKNAIDAAQELKVAADFMPSDANAHDLFGQALNSSGDPIGAIAEFRQSLALKPKQPGVIIELAVALERQGDWPAALAEYHRAAKADQRPESPTPGVEYRIYDAQRKYEEAQKRFTQHLADLRKAGKTTEAANLEKAISGAQSGSSEAEQLDALMQSGSQARQERRFDDAERDYKKALVIAEKVQPLDIRLATCLGHLGELAAARKDFVASEALLERALHVTEQIYGPQNVKLADPLKWLAMNAVEKSDLPTAEKFLNRALDVNRQAYGETSEGYSEILRLFAGVYMYKQQFDKAEPYLVQAAASEEKLYQYDPRYGPLASLNLWQLCSLYESWGKPEKLESCDRRLISALERDNSPAGTQTLAMALTREAKTLRTLGRPNDAAKIEERLKSLSPAAANNPNQ